jgi:hypothetical protein
VIDGSVATGNATQDIDVEARITGPYTEPTEQGSAEYWRCEDYRRESLRRGDVEHSAFHAEECVLR